ncbi:L,D-transpeptidase [Candidatus Gottesmanbacteria bacterium]|nr:L,D-transpeptidase [Candidatus Gottesmanbacteria bacterium]
MKLTSFEKAWVRIMGFLAFVIVGVFMIQPLIPAFHAKVEPLADPGSLKKLIAGLPLPVPAQETKAEFLGKTITPPSLALLSAVSRVLGTATSSEEKRIEVDLTHQRVYAFEGNRKVYEFVVSTGKWAPTPTGEFTIWAKVKSQKMSGGSGNTYYYLPNVPYVMFFYNNEVAQARGFSLHGTYWHNNFGHPMSHGCVNMRIEDAKTLFEWSSPQVTDPKAWSTNATSENPGTRVIIYGITPTE